jgi:hypothetical protein
MSMKGAFMKALGWFLLLGVVVFAAFSYSLVSASNMGCFDIITNSECHGASVPAELERLRVA